MSIIGKNVLQISNLYCQLSLEFKIPHLLHSQKDPPRDKAIQSESAPQETQRSRLNQSIEALNYCFLGAQVDARVRLNFSVSLGTWRMPSNNYTMNNVQRALFKRLTVKFAGKILQDTEG